LKAKIYTSMKQSDDALLSVNKALEVYHDLDKAWLMRALLLQDKKDINGAINAYEKFLDISPHNDDVRKQFVMFLSSVERFKDAKRHLEQIKDDSDNHYCNLALLEWKGGDKDAALIKINKALEKNASYLKAKVLKVELLAQLKRMDDAITFVSEWLKSKKHESMALKTMISLRRAGVSTQSLIAALEPLTTGKSGRNITAFLGDLYFESGLYDKALTAYTNLEKVVRDKVLKTKLLYQIGYTYYVSGKFDSVEKPLREVLKIDKSHSAAANLLASYYARENNKLPQALELVESALKIESTNTAFLDTKKHIVSKLGKQKSSQH